MITMLVNTELLSIFDLQNVLNQKTREILFTLPEEFINNFKGKQPKWGPLGYFIYKRTYARLIEDNETNELRTEEFYETLRRVVEGVFTYQKRHCILNKYPWNEEKALESAKEMYQRMWDFKLLPPGRGLWAVGTEFVDKKGGAACNNCGFISTENLEKDGSKIFRWIMDMLMLGIGIGFDTKGANTCTIKKPKIVDYVYVIPDSRIGWVTALGLLIDPFIFEENKLIENYKNRKQENSLYNEIPLINGIPKFDFSKIRPKGSLIRGFGGIASGPEPLIEMLDNIYNIFNEKIGKLLTSVDIIDIVTNIAKCVIAGNVRRSATLALGDLNDMYYLDAKNPEIINTQPLYRQARWGSNNSVIVKIGDNYKEFIKRIILNGEPGLVWLDNARKYSRMCDPPNNLDYRVMGCNPCSEQSLESYELCCLVEVFPNKHDSYEDFRKTLKMAYLYAKTITLLKTHWLETNVVMDRNRRIGISLSGIINAHARLGKSTVLNWAKKGYEYITEIDKRYSEDWLIINRSIKKTTIKPSGTISLLSGETPGIHYPHSEYYIRRVRIESDSKLIPILQNAGYIVYPDKRSKIKTSDNSTKEEYSTMIVIFPIHEKNFSCSKDNVSIWKQLANVIDYQKYWSDNQISVTITFKKEEEKELEDLIIFAEDKVKSLSFLPLEDHGYEDAPYEKITKEQYIELTKNLKNLDFSLLQSDGIRENFCNADGKCNIL